MEKRVINTAELAKMIAKVTGETQKATIATLKALKDVAHEELAKAADDAPVEVKICSGVSLISEFVPAHEGRNPMTGEIVQVEDKIRTRGKIYPTFNKMLNAAE